MTIELAISNLETTRDYLIAASLKEDNYNSPWGNALEMMGWGLHRYAQELKEQKYEYGDYKNVS